MKKIVIGTLVTFSIGDQKNCEGFVKSISKGGRYGNWYEIRSKNPVMWLGRRTVYLSLRKNGFTVNEKQLEELRGEK